VRAGELNRFWRWALPLATALFHGLFRVRVRGMEHVPASGPALLVFNHVSSLDGLSIGTEIGRRLRRPTRFLVAAEFFEKPLTAWVLRGTDQIPIRRGRADRDALKAIAETVRAGKLAGLAPEGRIDDHEGRQGLQRVRSGVARVALPTGSPVVPIGVWGTQVRYPRTGISLRRPLRPRLAIAIGSPILPAGDVGTPADVAAFVERVQRHLETQVGLARQLAGDPA
jgi:1-acyl-sn-glycerol-3-phosphate acyltransferase